MPKSFALLHRNGESEITGIILRILLREALSKIGNGILMRVLGTIDLVIGGRARPHIRAGNQGRSVNSLHIRVRTSFRWPSPANTAVGETSRKHSSGNTFPAPTESQKAFPRETPPSVDSTFTPKAIDSCRAKNRIKLQEFFELTHILKFWVLSELNGKVFCTVMVGVTILKAAQIIQYSDDQATGCTSIRFPA